MQKEIAVILDKDLQLTTYQEVNRIRVYKREGSQWKIHKEILVNDIYNGGLLAIRRHLLSLQTELKDCKIIIGTSITGVVYQVFNQTGFIISELPSFHEAMLDTIYDQINEKLIIQKEDIKENNNIPTKPYETNKKDFYFFDFSLLKNSNIPHSSKSTILPFIKSTSFEQLEIICDHIMPWLDYEVQKNNLIYETRKMDSGQYKIIIKPANR
jgi:Fe-only nitrogenase accessory protein AnfO